VDSEIYVNNNDLVENYFVKINENKLKNIQNDIDDFNGKGSLKYKKVDKFSFELYNSGKKVDVVSKKYVGKGQLYDVNFPEILEVDLYEYSYYSYLQCELSKIIEDILNAYKRLDLSKSIRSLMEYNPVCCEEEKFLKEIFNCIEMKKIDCKNLITIHISNSKKQSVFNRIIKTVKNNKGKYIVSSADYVDVMNKEISELENKMLKKGKYTTEEKDELKRNILDSLPTKNQINNKI